jgi:adenine-specific DNA-methyltransferase
MLDWGLELSLPIERKTIAGKEVFYVAGNSLVACFDDLTFDVLMKLPKIILYASYRQKSHSSRP